MLRTVGSLCQPSLLAVTTDDTRLSRMKRAVPDGITLAGRVRDENGTRWQFSGTGRKWDPLRARPSAAPQATSCVRARTSQRDSSGRQSATGGHAEDMRSDEEPGGDIRDQEKSYEEPGEEMRGQEKV